MLSIDKSDHSNEKSLSNEIQFEIISSGNKVGSLILVRVKVDP